MTVSAAELARAFDGHQRFTFGVEEELILVEPEGFGLAEIAHQVCKPAEDGDGPKPELPLSQVELTTQPATTVDETIGQLAQARRDLVRLLDGRALPLSVGVHPWASTGRISTGGRYHGIAERYGAVAQRQVVSSLQVHVAVPGDGSALEVYNALRAFLPLIAALGANAPFYEGRDTGMASVRPLVCSLLPRQGIPPRLESWDHYARELKWSELSGVPTGVREWWWELRLHPRFGTLEVRVADSQLTIAEVARLCAFVACLVAWLAADRDAATTAAGSPTWRIHENRWLAARHGLDGEMAEPWLDGGHRRGVREWIQELSELGAMHAQGFGCVEGLRAAGLADVNGALKQRSWLSGGGEVSGRPWGCAGGSPTSSSRRRDYMDEGYARRIRLASSVGTRASAAPASPATSPSQCQTRTAYANCARSSMADGRTAQGVGTAIEGGPQLPAIRSRAASMTTGPVLDGRERGGDALEAPRDPIDLGVEEPAHARLGGHDVLGVA